MFINSLNYIHKSYLKPTICRLSVLRNSLDIRNRPKNQKSEVLQFRFRIYIYKIRSIFLYKIFLVILILFALFCIIDSLANYHKDSTSENMEVNSLIKNFLKIFKLIMINLNILSLWVKTQSYVLREHGILNPRGIISEIEKKED